MRFNHGGWSIKPGSRSRLPVHGPRQPDSRASAPSQLRHELVLAVEGIADASRIKVLGVIVAAFLLLKRRRRLDAGELPHAALAHLGAEPLVPKDGSA